MIAMIRRVLGRTAATLIPLGAVLGAAFIFNILFDITKTPLKAIFVIFFIIMGLLGGWAAVNPQSFFRYWYRWLLLLLAKDPEPSKVAIALTRLKGIILIIVCIIGLAMALFT